METYRSHAITPARGIDLAVEHASTLYDIMRNPNTQTPMWSRRPERGRIACLLLARAGVRQEIMDEPEDELGPEIVAPQDPRAQAILEGFRMCALHHAERQRMSRPWAHGVALPCCSRLCICTHAGCCRSDWMNMSDAATGEILWEESEGWDDLLTERDIHIPARILRCRGVSREFQFSSVEMLQGLRLEQRIFLRGNLMEGARPRSHAL